jgi:hypothetical protein
LGPREDRCEVRVVRRSRATALGTTHARPRGHFEHAADSVLREVLRRRLRVQVRTRPDAAVSRRARGYRDLADARICASRAKARGVSPRDASVADWAAERRVRASRRRARGSSFDGTSFGSVWRSEDLGPPPRGAHRAGFPRAREIEVLPLARHTRATDGPLLPATPARIRHVVLPPDIAKLLPKGRLLSEVRRARYPPFDRPAAPGLRPPRASRLPAISRHVAAPLGGVFKASPRRATGPANPLLAPSRARLPRMTDSPDPFLDAG